MRRSDDELRRLGENVARLREAAGLKQEELTEKAGLSSGYLSRLENGHVDPKASFLLRVAAALNTTVAELLDEDRIQIADRARSLLDDPEARTYVVRIGSALRRANPEEERRVKAALSFIASGLEASIDDETERRANG